MHLSVLLHTHKKKSPLHILKQCQICIYGYEFRFVCLSRICQFLEFLSRLRTLVIKVFHTFFHFWIGDLSLNWWSLCIFSEFSTHIIMQSVRRSKTESQGGVISLGLENHFWQHTLQQYLIGYMNLRNISKFLLLQCVPQKDLYVFR